MTPHFEDHRPPKGQRCFVSNAVDELVEEIVGEIADAELAWLFRNCFPNTLDTTVRYELRDDEPETFIITGDIDAMWLRDSTAQVWPYLSLLVRDAHLQRMIRGLIRRQARCVTLDPYANAFYPDAKIDGKWRNDIPAPKPGVHEGKYELDSLCYFFRLATGYWRVTRDCSPFDAAWLTAVNLALSTIRLEQAGSDEQPSSSYTFRRPGSETLGLYGRGDPRRRCGMSRSPFRPSDDIAKLPYLVPAMPWPKRCSANWLSCSPLSGMGKRPPKLRPWRGKSRMASRAMPRSITRDMGQFMPTRWTALAAVTLWTTQTCQACSRCHTSDVARRMIRSTFEREALS
jgi:hypothetical protein